MTNLEAAFEAAEEIGIKLEIVNGLTVWEGSPVYRHQKAIDRTVQARDASEPPKD